MQPNSLPTETAPNTRVSVLRAWLAKPPSAAKELVLRATAGIDAPDVQLGAWSVDEVVPQLAVEILEALDEHAGTVGGAVVARLAFMSAAGGEVKVKVVNRSTATMAPPESLGDVQLDGSARSQVVQAQAFAQAAVQQLLRSNAVVLAQSVELSKHATEVARTLADDLRMVRARLQAEQAQTEHLKETIAALPEGGAASEVGSGALAKLLEPHLPILVQLVAAHLAKTAA